MKKAFTSYLVMMICGLVLSLSSFAQNATQDVVNKINKTNKKINSTDSAVNGTSDAINGTSGVVKGAGAAIGNLGGSIVGLFKKKQKDNSLNPSANKTDTSTSALKVRTENKNAIVISIAGVDYAKLKKLKDGLKAIAGVQSFDMVFGPTGSSLNVSYNKNAGDLWDDLSNDISAQYNIISLNNTAIGVAYKQ